MRIKPYWVLGLATLCASGALATVVTTNDPYLSEPRMIWLFWAAFSVSVWGLVATVFSLTRQRLALALIHGACWSAALVLIAIMLHRGITDRRLFGAIIGATLVLSSILWWRNQKMMVRHEPAR